jgi:hypothetical protein
MFVRTIWRVGYPAEGRKSPTRKRAPVLALRRKNNGKTQKTCSQESTQDVSPQAPQGCSQDYSQDASS